VKVIAELQEKMLDFQKELQERWSHECSNLPDNSQPLINHLGGGQRKHSQKTQRGAK